ncbi:MAG: glycerol-3-phosphate 1-O-acyltransferase PlsY [Verrucomicrobiales bacterium]|nr:glycerol-3-phosphate 1-O-acyltransferase PlsY [Verrucomicrobiales bacterium]
MAAYFVGSVPTGFLAGRARGVDVRTLGSGNIGATNVIRFLGKPMGFFVLLVDSLKGWIACTALVKLAISLFPSSWTAVSNPQTDGAFPIDQQFEIVAGLFAVLGHNYTCWLKFKGGKGIATSAGVLLAWVPLGLLVALAMWLLVFLLSRYVSLASIGAALVLPFAVWLTRNDPVYIWIAAALSALAIYKHKANIQRLLSGTEHRFSSHKTSAAAPP